ncbi:DinB family protein [Agreia sp. VKM Ac-1783]|uniref:DinB family protein n=1 Tax=Agreia sp. VKM Ac-1783 TaxID=1938889 RepID=UPI000A2AABD5|nr:DinB family protein [Agreia sp. VKM Ac-1783]SMQ75020.1 DinB superfamily protein [Agreia sp. VKM Ac-1783]
MPIVPETKSWTWVLEKPCPECGFDASTADAREVAELTRENAAAWPAVLQRADVRERPDGDTWSPLEYAAHVRDVFTIMRGRLELMLAENDPQFANWDQDATAVEERYNEQDPTVVATQLVEAGRAIADAFDGVPVDAWGRSGRRGDGAGFTVETLAQYFIHDPVHHLHDVSKA